MPSRNLDVLILDFKKLSSGELVYLETGSAFHSGLHETVLEMLWDEVVNTFPKRKIYTSLLQFQVPTRYRLHADVVIEKNLMAQIFQGKLKEGVFVFETAQETEQAYAFKVHHQLNDLIIINARTMLSTENKVVFYEICREAKIRYPESYLMSPYTFEREKHKLPKDSPTGWIIKPPDATAGRGCAYFDTQTELLETVAFLNDREKKNPLKDDRRFCEFWNGKNYRDYPYIIQKMVSGLNDNGREVTYRIVFSIKNNGNDFSFKTLRIAEKFALFLPKKCSASVISITPKSAAEFGVSYEGYNLKIEEKDRRYAHIAKTVESDMRKFMPVVNSKNPRDLWMAPVRADCPFNDYTLYFLMPKIERNNLSPYDEKTMNVFLRVIASSDEKARAQMLIPFRYGYFGISDCLFPNFARTMSLFSLIIYYIRTESNRDILGYIKDMAKSYIALHDKNEKLLTWEEKTALLSDQLKKGCESIIKLIDHELSPSAKGAAPAQLYGPYAYWGYWGYFPEKQTQAQASAISPLEQKSSCFDTRCPPDAVYSFQ